MRAIRVADSPARPSRLKNEPGILPAAYIRSSTSTVSGMKSMSRRLPAVAVPRTRVSPEATRTEPEACLARRPVSNTMVDPPISTETSCTSDMCSFLTRRSVCWRALLLTVSVPVIRVHGSCPPGWVRVSAMPSRIVVFGATGYTGRLCAERLVARGERPLLAGRSEARLAALGSRLGLEWRVADVRRPATVFALVEQGDVLVSTVGPFAKWGGPAVRAAVAAPGRLHRLDGRARLHPPRARGARAGGGARGRRAAHRHGLRLRAGHARRRAGRWRRRARRPSASTSATTCWARGPGCSAAARRRRWSGVVLEPMFAFRDGRLRPAAAAERARSFRVAGRGRPAVSIGGAEHFSLPAAYPRLREVNVYLGWAGGPAQAVQLAGARDVAGHAGAGRAAPRCGSAGSSSPPGCPRPRRAPRPARLVDRRRGPRRRGRAPGGGAPARRRPLRVHGGLPRLGGEPRGVRGGRPARARSGPSRRSGSRRSSAGAPRPGWSAPAPDGSIVERPAQGEVDESRGPSVASCGSCSMPSEKRPSLEASSVAGSSAPRL